MDDPDHTLADIAARVAAVSPAWRSALAASLPAARIDAVRAPLGLGVEMIYEGHALHRGAGRVLASGAGPDLALLVGDFCYAAGLCEIAGAGDLDAVRTLAALIADTALLAVEGERPAGSPDPRDLRWDEALAELGPRT